jgi:polysaccharide biosynthesis protein PslH
MNKMNNNIRKPNILYLTKVFPYPPATAGDAVYTRGIIESLMNHANLTVLCSENGSTQIKNPSICWINTGAQKKGQIGSILSKWPLISWRNSTRQFHNALNTELQKSWDAIVLDSLGLAHALDSVKNYKNKHPKTKTFYISLECEYQTRKSKYSAYNLNFTKKIFATLDLWKVKKYEDKLLIDCDVVTVINVADVSTFKKVAPSNKYLPFSPGYSDNIVCDRKIDGQTPRKILLLGGRKSEQKKQILLDWMKLSYDTILAAGIDVVVAGDMDDNLRDVMKEKYPKVTVCGFVNDLTELIQTARMGLIVDTVGGGFKMRLLSHVFERLPIIGLSDAISGLPTNEGTGYIGAATLDSLLKKVLTTIDDDELLNNLHNRAFNDCITKYSWDSRSELFIKIISDSGHDILI